MKTKKLNLLNYPSSLGSPKIDTSELEISKHQEVHKMNHFFKGKFEELVKEYENLLLDFELNKKILSSDYKFIPSVGQVCYLYERKDGSFFLSIIEPTQWKKKLVCIVKYNSNYKWDLIEK